MVAVRGPGDGGKAGRQGKASTPDKPDDSLLYKVLKDDVKAGSDTVHRMPKGRGGEGKKLADDQIDVIKRWIDQGAKWPDGGKKK